MTTEEHAGSDDQIQISLVDDSGTWWKAVTEFDHDNFIREIVATSDCQGETRDAVVPQSDITGKGYYLVLSKAKAFGVHTNMYHIKNAADMKPGIKYIFHWEASAANAT